MSLLNGFLLDALLQNVVQQEVYLAVRTDGSPGSGTELDPFSAGGSASDEDPPFDRLMRGLPENTTVRLLPGTYYTNGFNFGTNGWRPKSGTRIAGASIMNTTLKLTNHIAANILTSVIGSNPQSKDHFLEAFELDNLTLDCTIPGNVSVSDASTAGVTVNGRDIYIHDVLVKGMERRGGPETHGICAAVAYDNPNGDPVPYMLTPENCVVERCRVEAPAGSSGLAGIQFRSDTDGVYHKFCVVRNCYVSLAGSAGYVGLAVSGGLGTILEHNRVVNCAVGIGFAASGGVVNSSRDMIVRHNYIGSTPAGLVFEFTTANRNCERLVLLNNYTDWPSAASAPNPTGISLTGSALARRFIARDNIFKRMAEEPPSGGTGLDLTAYEEAIVENNIIDVSDPAHGVRHPNSGKITVFNNLRSDGTLLRGYNTGTGLWDSELAVEVEDVYLAL